MPCPNELRPSPLGAIFAVFDGHAEFFEFIAELVRERPLFLFARFVTFCNQRIDLCFDITGACLFFQLQAKHASEFTQHCLCKLQLFIICTVIA